MDKKNYFLGKQVISKILCGQVLLDGWPGCMNITFNNWCYVNSNVTEYAKIAKSREEQHTDDTNLTNPHILLLAEFCRLKTQSNADRVTKRQRDIWT